MRRLLTCLMLLATPIMAQEAAQVTLTYDDGTGVTGELIRFEDGKFFVQASVGLVAIDVADVVCAGAACPEGTAAEAEVADLPKQVTLKSLDGQLTISGDMVDFVDGKYVVSNPAGELRVDAAQVTCEGEGCIEPDAPVSNEVVLVNGTTTIPGKLLGFEDGTYIVETQQLGQVRIDASVFACEGAACP